MSIQDTLGTLANNLRSASGYQNKLSLADMSSMATGLTTYNLLPDTSTSYKEVSVEDNQWSCLLYRGLSLPAGTYTYSVYVDLAGFNNPTSNRIEWSKIGVGNTGLVGKSPIDSYDWGTLSDVYIQPNQQGLITITFKLAVADTINVGFSGNPYTTKGTFKYARPMLNVGTFPLPYTSNTLVRGGREIIKPNLLPSQFNTTGWIIQGQVVTDSEGINAVQLVPGGSGVSKGANIGLTGVDFTSTYTWTFWARADNAGDKLHTELWGGGGSNDISLTTEWEKYQVQGKFLPRLQALYFWGLESNKGNVYVKLPYLYKD